jgi:signal transduction histidine kinase
MEADRTRAAVFFIQYLALLLAALVWVQLDFVRRRMAAGNATLFYLLIGAAACFLALRAWLVCRRRIPRKWSSLWLSLDLAVITCAVYLTGGINSEAALLYLWPIVTSSIRRLPRRTIAVSAATVLLYLIASWQDHGSEKYWGTLMVRMLVLLMATSLAIYYSRTESALIEELVRLREEVALSDYRTRLSREMHDGIQHYLASIAVRLELARRLVDTDPAEAARIATAQRFAIRQASAELRYLVRLLRSPALEQEGFVDALRHHLSLLTEGSSMSVRLEVGGEARPLPPDVAQAAFRVMQEALMNAERHAHATEVKIKLNFGADRFGCTIEDNGVGFDPASLPRAPGPAGGFGLPGMSQRADSVGGKVEVSSAPGQGTLVAFTAPVVETGTGEKGP